jgi:hypothetical protein
MSFLSTIFGGSSTTPVGGINPNKGQGYIDKLDNYDPTMYGGIGGGAFLRGAKQDYRRLRSGADISSIPGFSGTLGAINASYASGDKVRDREMGLNPALLNQPELMAAQQADLQRQSNQDRSNTVAGAAGNFYNTTQNFGQNAFESQQQRRLQAAQMKLAAEQAAAGNYFGAFRQNQQGGIIPGLAKLGESAASVAPLFCDERLKDNIQPYETGLEVITNLKVKEFDYNGSAGTETGKHALGVIAQDAATIDPELTVSLGNSGYVGIDPQRLMFLLVNSVKELSAQVKDLQAQLSAQQPATV